MSTTGNQSADAVPPVANFWQASPMGIGPSARLEGHFSPVTPLPGAVRVRLDSDEQLAEGEAPPPSPEQTSARGKLTDDDSDDSGMSLSSGESDPELCIIGRAMILRANPSSNSPSRSDSSPDSPVLPPGVTAEAGSMNGSESDSMTDYKLMSNAKEGDLYAELLQAQGVDVSPRDEDDRGGPSAFSTTSTIKAEAADSATWRCVVPSCDSIVKHPLATVCSMLTHVVACIFQRRFVLWIAGDGWHVCNARCRWQRRALEFSEAQSAGLPVTAGHAPSQIAGRTHAQTSALCYAPRMEKSTFLRLDIHTGSSSALGRGVLAGFWMVVSNVVWLRYLQAVIFW